MKVATRLNSSKSRYEVPGNEENQIPSRRDASDFVPEGLDDGSQAIYCLVSVQKGEPSRRARYD